MSTVMSSSEHLGRLHEGSDGETGSLDSRGQVRNSLKDQFKLLRLQDEGIPVGTDDQASIGSGEGKGSRSSVGSPGLDAPDATSAAPLPSPIATSPLPSTVNPELPPGTVSGFSASATDASAPVDWELWQQVVNSGPESLVGENSEKLNAAIKRGIPQTIRGVIWQVLADSRNPELEHVYRELCARGTDKDPGRSLSSTSIVSINGNSTGSPKERESISSRSSIRSDNSTQASTGTVSEKDSESVAKAKAALEAERKRRSKEDAAALQKLEKQIRRDLGSRTSYSKYFMSQRNQEGLFNICKAYALYDSGVGYAQGMNFIAMPLLFNVSDLLSPLAMYMTNVSLV